MFLILFKGIFHDTINKFSDVKRLMTFFPDFPDSGPPQPTTWKIIQSSLSWQRGSHRFTAYKTETNYTVYTNSESEVID